MYGEGSSARRLLALLVLSAIFFALRSAWTPEPSPEPSHDRSPLASAAELAAASTTTSVTHPRESGPPGETPRGAADLVRDWAIGRGSVGLAYVGATCSPETSDCAHEFRLQATRTCVGWGDPDASLVRDLERKVGSLVGTPHRALNFIQPSGRHLVLVYPGGSEGGDLDQATSQRVRGLVTPYLEEAFYRSADDAISQKDRRLLAAYLAANYRIPGVPPPTSSTAKLPK